jgi:hypothetical protein
VVTCYLLPDDGGEIQSLDKTGDNEIAFGNEKDGDNDKMDVIAKT